MNGGEHREDIYKSVNWNVWKGLINDPRRSDAVLIYLCYNELSNMKLTLRQKSAES